jgi:hypothetical protein
MIDLTVHDIEQEMSKFHERISKAKTKLADLPTGYLPYQEYKKREKQRRGLQSDIKHLQQLMSYANESVALRRQEARYRQ